MRNQCGKEALSLNYPSKVSFLSGTMKTKFVLKQCGILVILISTLSVVACKFSPKEGKIITVRIQNEPNASYGIVGGEYSEINSDRPLIIALPTRFETRRDVTRDIDSIWSFQAKLRNWVFVIPASSQGFPFDLSPSSGFGLGGERSIPHIVEDLRSQGFLNHENIFLIDLWGNGAGLVSVIDQVPSLFRHVILAPSASIDLNILEKVGEVKRPDRFYSILQLDSANGAANKEA